jgi:hypothetical protein
MIPHPMIGLEANVNLAGVLHGEQELIFHNPIPVEGTMTTTGKITHYYDKGKDKGALVVGESDTFHCQRAKAVHQHLHHFRPAGRRFRRRKRPKKEVIFPDREPDFTVEAAPSPDQPLIYRLSGDVFSLHVDPEFAKMSGFEKPIMHGLCTHGFACRALIGYLIPANRKRRGAWPAAFPKPSTRGHPH